MTFDTSLPPFAAWALALALLSAWVSHRLTLAREAKKRSKIVPRLLTRAISGSVASEYSALVVENCGESEVKDFALTFRLPAGSKSPVIDAKNQAVDRIELPILHAGQKFEWTAVFFYRAPIQFDAEWSWINSKGRRQEKEGILKLERLGLP